jgi:integrase
VVQVGLLTGFRRQELTSLRPDDVDIGNGTVSVAACYAKNGESRTLPVGPRLKVVLQDAVTASGSALTVLVNEHGRPWTRNTDREWEVSYRVSGSADRVPGSPCPTAHVCLSSRHGWGRYSDRTGTDGA